MGKSKNDRVTFRLEGRLLSYECGKNHKAKRLRISTRLGEQTLKLSQEAKRNFPGAIVAGDWVEVVGEQKIDRATSAIKWRAHSIQVVAVTAFPTLAQPVAKILFCQKPGCMKRGGKAICQAFEQALVDRNLTDRVTLQGTGCMKACSNGPNLVMPGKNRYSRVAAAAIPALVDEYFPPKTATSPHTQCPQALGI